MKSLFAVLAVSLGTFAVQSASAQDAPNPQAEIQFAKSSLLKLNQKFKFKVTHITCKQASATGQVKNAPIPSGVPKFKKGQKVNFKIDGKGNLTGPGFSIKFQGDAGALSASYANLPSRSNLDSQSGIVIMNSQTGKPDSASVTFTKVSGSGFGTKLTTVVYIME